MSIINALLHRFIITSHARERFIERFSEDKKIYIHLKLCSLKECQVCRDLAFQIVETAAKDQRKWDDEIRKKLEDSQETKIFLNNTNFMDAIYKKYGYDGRYHFFTDGAILWAVCEKGARYVLKTCMDVRRPVNGSTVLRDFVRRPKYNKT